MPQGILFYMKKLFCALALAGALLCSGCHAEKMSSLKDISRPYAGEYRCKKLLLGGEDLLGNFDYLKLQLDGSGTYRLFYAGDGGEGEQTGEYDLSPEEGTVTLRARSGNGEKTYVFPYRKGKISLGLQFREKFLYAEFSMASE